LHEADISIELFSYIDSYPLIVYFTSKKYKVHCMERVESHWVNNCLHGWPEYKVITLGRDDKIGTTGSTSSSEFADQSI